MVTCRPRTTRLALSISVSLALLLFGAAVGTASAARAAAGPASAPSTGAGDLLTYGYSNSRSGASPASATTKTLSAGSVWNDADFDGAVYGEPLLDGRTVYVATEGDSVYAVAASSGRVEWRLRVGTPVPLSIVDAAPTLQSSCGDIDPLGITGTPVIDAAHSVLYVAEETLQPGTDDWQGVRHWLVAVSLSSGHELWHRDIDPPARNQAASYYIAAEQQRPALTLLDGRVYVPFGGLAGDCGQYHGYVVSLPASGSGALDTYQVPTDREGAIWETEGALVATNGELYVATGNGSSNTLSHFDEGNAIIELSAALQRLGYWAPANWVALNDSDWDLGSAGPIQVPGSSLLFVAGKRTSSGSVGYLANDGRLGGVGRTLYTGPLCSNGGVFGSDATAVLGSGAAMRVLIFVPCGGGTEAIEVNRARARFQVLWTVSGGSPNGSPILAAGVLWALDWDNGLLYGINPTDGHVIFKRSTAPLDHFAVPAVADGMVFVPTTHGVEAFRTAA